MKPWYEILELVGFSKGSLEKVYADLVVAAMVAMAVVVVNHRVMSRLPAAAPGFIPRQTLALSALYPF